MTPFQKSACFIFFIFTDQPPAQRQQRSVLEVFDELLEAPDRGRKKEKPAKPKVKPKAYNIKTNRYGWQVLNEKTNRYYWTYKDPEL